MVDPAEAFGGARKGNGSGKGRNQGSGDQGFEHGGPP
jgi:hypothetical protein